MTPEPKANLKNKETVYIDVDDEITNIIDKVKSSDSKIVALVLPKRATVLQSVVNMKLLKKAASKAKKSVVLITNEAGLMPLAGVAGIHVAKSLQSKPVIPALPKQPGDSDEAEEIGDNEDDAIDKTATIGALTAAAVVAANSDEPETIELDNLDMDNKVAPEVKAAGKAGKKKKHLKVPNFERFRLSVVLAIAGVFLLLIGWYVAFVVMPKATITITTDTTTVVSAFDFTASTTTEEIDIEDNVIPAKSNEVKKTDSKKVPATGEKDMGTKASGEVTLSITCSAENFGTTIPSGTAVSNGGLNFITQQTAVLNTLGGGCNLVDTVDVLAAENGDQYNIGSGKTFSVSGYSDVSASNDDSFSGGTTKMVKVVSQKDIDNAVAEIDSNVSDSVEEELSAMFAEEDMMPLPETLQSTDPKITASPALDKEATEVTVTVDTTYTMLGVYRADLNKLIEQDVSDEVDLSKQSISNDGIDDAIMRINNQTSPTEAFISFRSSVTAGPEIDVDAIKEEVRGKKRGEAEKYIEGLPGVDNVVVEYSPFWVYSTPKAAKKITVTVEKPEDVQPNDQSSNESE